MGWMQKLYETFENNQHMVGVAVADKTTLSPIYHMIAKAQIEVTITDQGEFVNATVVDKKNCDTIIPVTNDSAGRTSGIITHPLCDNLTYVAGDYSQYFKGDKKRYERYMEELCEWAESMYSDVKVRAVYLYCKKSRLIGDLIYSGVIKRDENLKIVKAKIEGNDYEKCIVRWIVLTDDETQNAVWQDNSLINKYIDYYKGVQANSTTDICYVTLKNDLITANHPKGVVAHQYGAKLVAANDSSGFTYRGRFTDSNEAISVSNEVSQKAHNALKWLVKNQGVIFGGRVFICFNPKGKEVPKLGGAGLFGFSEDEVEVDRTASTMPEYRKKLIMALAGYRKLLNVQDDIVIISLDAATTGRLSVTYYNELKASDFLDRLESWYNSCCFYFTRFTKEKKPYLNVETPTTEQIINCAFGTEQGGLLKSDDNVFKEQSQRILHCILDKQPIPQDIVHMLSVRASMPQAYSRGNYEKILSTACAVIKKYKNERFEREDYTMELDLNSKNRSYLFGRLLAVAERVERITYDTDEKRQPNAMRLQSAFCQRPMHTWRLIEESLNPYYAKLKPTTRSYFKNRVSDIISNLQQTDMNNLNLALEDVYLLGYYLERKELNTYKVNNNEEENNNEHTN